MLRLNVTVYFVLFRIFFAVFYFNRQVNFKEKNQLDKNLPQTDNYIKRIRIQIEETFHHKKWKRLNTKSLLNRPLRYILILIDVRTSESRGELPEKIKTVITQLVSIYKRVQAKKTGFRNLSLISPFQPLKWIYERKRC